MSSRGPDPNAFLISVANAISPGKGQAVSIGNFLNCDSAVSRITGHTRCVTDPARAACNALPAAGVDAVDEYSVASSFLMLFHSSFVRIHCLDREINRVDKVAIVHQYLKPTQVFAQAI